MPSKRELDNAIEELLDAPSSYKGCLKLAVFLFLRDHLYPGEKEPERKQVETAQGGETEFRQAIAGKRVNDLLPVFDELMEATAAYNPRLYTATIMRLHEI